MFNVYQEKKLGDGLYSIMEKANPEGQFGVMMYLVVGAEKAALVDSGFGVTVDHTLTCYNYYGITGMTLENAANTGYTLAASLNGQVVYYAEDEAGNGYLTYNQEEAWIGDGTELVEGYNLSGAGIVDVAKWPWTTRYQSGWTYATPQPTGLPYVDGSYTYGYEPGGSNPAYDAELAS